MNIVTEHYMTARDGVKLYTTVQLPAADGKFPTVIMRTPYDKLTTDFSALAAEDTCGYALVNQQCRGTARSEGECNAYLHEREDGLDLLEWVRKQPFYNGEIYLRGTSYRTSVHFAYLDTDPADIRAAVLAVQDSERYNVCYRNGFFKTGLHGKWVFGMHRRNQHIERNFTLDTMRTMPLAGVTRAVFNEFVPYIEESFVHPDPDDPYWRSDEGGGYYSDVCNKCSMPILLVTSWYDIYTGGVFAMWRSLRPERRKRCALIVTPFDHAFDPLPEAVPEESREFMADGSMRTIDPRWRYRWFELFRQGRAWDFVEPGKIAYYRLWDNRWIIADDIRNGETVEEWYLDAERRLLPGGADAGEITYTYNPYAPAKFEGGVCNNFGGMKYQDEPNSRYDIISFLSAPLDADRVCEGEIEIELHCRSTAEDTCFYVRLDVVRDGKALPLRDDIDSLRRWNREYRPGDECAIRYKMAPHAFKLRRGDVLRLDVSSSCVPYFQVHTNYPGLQALQPVGRVCRNTILTGRSLVRIFVRKEPPECRG